LRDLPAKYLLMKRGVVINFDGGVSQVLRAKFGGRCVVLLCQHLNIRNVEQVIFVVDRASGNFVAALLEKSCYGIVFFLCVSGVIKGKAEETRSLAHVSEHWSKRVFTRH